LEILKYHLPELNAAKLVGKKCDFNLDERLTALNVIFGSRTWQKRRWGWQWKFIRWGWGA
jgi:hypothetical protein